MEHAEALERIEIAAAEPEGLERLMAGDTADAAAIAGHLAGCPSCAAEMARIRRTASVARDVIRAQPDPELRGRTLAYVRAVGVARGGAAAAAEVDAGSTAPVAASSAPASGSGLEPGPTGETGASPAPVPIAAARRRRPPALGWLAVAAAIVVVALGAGYLAGSPGRERLQSSERQVALLERTASTTLRIQAQPDATRVALAATPEGGSAEGTLLFSPSTGELVMIATDLAPTGPGQEYGCWVEAGGTRTHIGRMYWAGRLWTWAGPVEGLAELPPDAVFGVSIGTAGSADAVPVLTSGI